ncbi:hypothetical protein DMENIID0001_034120 [Sergentomyia squamirostris]
MIETISCHIRLKSFLKSRSSVVDGRPRLVSMGLYWYFIWHVIPSRSVLCGVTNYMRRPYTIVQAGSECDNLPELLVTQTTQLLARRSMVVNLTPGGEFTIWPGRRVIHLGPELLFHHLWVIH